MKKLALIFTAAGIAILASGCSMASSDEKDNASTQLQQQCSAENYLSFVGQKLTPEVTEKIQAQSSVIRIIRPNQAVTMDYNGARVNIHLDDKDQIIQVTCG